MREIIRPGVENAVKILTSLKGTPLKIRINRGRNRMEEVEGTVETLYPAIFTIRENSGALNSFSYADFLSKNIVLKKK